jgi:hypothetical protein
MALCPISVLPWAVPCRRREGLTHPCILYVASIDLLLSSCRDPSSALPLHLSALQLLQNILSNRQPHTWVAKSMRGGDPEVPNAHRVPEAANLGTHNEASESPSLLVMVPVAFSHFPLA